MQLSTGKVPGKSQQIWTTSFANKLGRLANGVQTRQPTGTKTIFYIAKDQVHLDRTVTYGHLVCNIRPQKQEMHRTRLTVGGNLINYHQLP
jgi:hypothetical protein